MGSFNKSKLVESGSLLDGLRRASIHRTGITSRPKHG
jgi:hypothetical protein